MSTPADPLAASSAAAGVYRIVPYLYVADVDATVAFYARLGFALAGSQRFPDGRISWACVQAPAYAPGCLPAALMFEPSCLPISTGAQGIFFYLHCRDAAALRARLLTDGLQNGGAYVGNPGAARQPNMVFEMNHPAYMPGGEFRVHDPDGYALLIGQPQ